ncbi:Syntaxin-like protein fsv1 [Schizosaccharomyces pombe]|uniref:Syntaxin-like protein fsv1 n=1 Tax=Schizosaccharomyces pombe (strain 972 / ATCC 24843) TaxID=284812 RepID=FSV1_SCHPO|nr:SNARE Fsv1 [Schizosaccharomyces pombe]O14222.3 RecName: Full=Syntaxin-like protein fsv1 [Schizosaccharomyces pombe 972h-]CAB11087.1 SNARE Fsv1 [Schizosaccharomyces pombe]|eukprot:NP_593289.1 SNARE Fsv1 [Schizosaccharomyces pombe]
MSNLLLIIDSVSQKIRDRRKLEEFGQNPDEEIESSLKDVRQELQKLNEEQSRLEKNAQIPEYRVRESEAFLIRMQRRLESAEEEFEKQRRASSIPADGTSAFSANPQVASTNNKLTPLPSLQKTTSSSEGSDIEMEAMYPVDGNDPDPINVNVLAQMHQQMLNEQEESLGGIEASVQRQKRMGYAMNTELSEQNVLLDNMNNDADRIERRFDHAKNRLNKVSRKAKQYPRCFIILLLCALLLLVASI